MERTEVLDMMSGLKLYGMRSAYDETLATALKRKHPTFGIKRISQTLRRIFHLSASPETVRKTLHREKLITPKKKKTPSNPSKPRFFERSTPNQMWQSDIFPFKLGGEAVHGIGATAGGPAGEGAGHGEGSAPGENSATPAGETGVTATLAGAGTLAGSAG